MSHAESVPSPILEPTEPGGIVGNPKRHTRNASKRHILAVAAGIAVGVFALLVCMELFLPSKPPALSDFRLDAPSTTGFMVLLAPALAAWAFSLHVRCPDAAIRNQLITIAVLLMLWMLDVVVKYPLRNDLAVSLCWYLYYVPMLFVPVLCLSCALRAAALDGTKAGKAMLWAAAAGSLLLVALVLTNNLHHGVFIFSFDDPGWQGNYRYNWGYWLVVGWIVLLYGAFFALLLRAARKQLRPSFAPLASIAGIAVAYSLMYGLRSAHVFTTNLALTYTVIIVVAIEVALAAGILPSYTWYREVFYKLPFDLKLIARSGDIAYSTAQSSPLCAEAAEKVAGSGTANSAPADFRVPSSPHTLYRTYPISGGTALLSLDASANDARRIALEQRQTDLAHTAQLLKRSAEVRRTLAKREAERELFEQVHTSLSQKSNEINRIIEGLPEGGSVESRDLRRKGLIRVKFLIAYCKRKGSLVVAQREGTSFTQAQVELIFAEAAADFRSMGIECAALFRIEESLSPAMMAQLYDCAYDFASLAFEATDPTLLMFAESTHGHALTVRIVLQCGNCQTLHPALHSLSQKLAEAGIGHSCLAEQDELSIKMELEDDDL